MMLPAFVGGCRQRKPQLGDSLTVLRHRTSGWFSDRSPWEVDIKVQDIFTLSQLRIQRNCRFILNAGVGLNEDHTAWRLTAISFNFSIKAVAIPSRRCSDATARS